MGARGSRRRERNPFGALAHVAERIATRGREHSWPSPKYRRDPVRFAREVLGVHVTDALRNFLVALLGNRNVTWRSGHKTGKTTAFAVAALWFFCSFERACVPIVAVKEAQIDFGVYKELRRLHRGALIPIGGELHATCRGGLHEASDDRKVWGMTAQKPEGVQGISGPNVLVLVDEASGVPDPVLEAIGTSTAGSGGFVRKAYAGNPTRTSGGFYRSHHAEKANWFCLHTSSEDTPNARGATGADVVPGLAGPDWIAEWKANPGEDSPEYAIRVKGEFHSGAEGKVVAAEAINTAEALWDATAFEGQLQLGIDPAGDKTTNDETAIAVRRGLKIGTLLTWRGLTPDGIVENALALLESHRLPREAKPRIALDAEGVIGIDVERALRARLLRDPEAFELVIVRGSKMPRQGGGSKYQLLRDEVWGEFRDWVEAGGAIPTRSKLRQDLNAPDFVNVLCKDGRERLSATPKKDLKKILGRSPDEGDAATLSVYGWQSASTEADEAEAAAAAAATASPQVDDYDAPAMNPYDGLAVWGG